MQAMIGMTVLMSMAGYALAAGNSPRTTLKPFPKCRCLWGMSPAGVSEKGAVGLQSIEQELNVVSVHHAATVQVNCAQVRSGKQGVHEERNVGGAHDAIGVCITGVRGAKQKLVRTDVHAAPHHTRLTVDVGG